MALRILIADDHQVVRRGLRSVLESQPGWEICGEASNGRDAVRKAKQLRPDVAVLDISMPELNGLEAARQIRKVSPRTELLVLTMHASDELAEEVLAAGVRGYLLKSDADHDLIRAVEAVRHHKAFFTPRVSQLVLDGYLRPAAQAPARGSRRHRLTPREREIVQLLAEGKSNKEAAAALGLSAKTVETHRANIMRKLQLNSFGELVRYAVRNNIVEA